MRIVRHILPALCLVVVMTTTAGAQRSLGERFTLAPGESERVGPHGLKVGFTALAGESRCPLGVFCFWEGDAAVGMWSNVPHFPRREFDLHSHGGFQTHITRDGHLIRLLRVDPYPVYEAPIDPDAYRVTVVVTAAITLPLRDTTWSHIKVLYR